jgi:hypothetical protein
VFQRAGFKVKVKDQDDAPAWQRYEVQRKCVVDGKLFRPGVDRPPNAKTCSPECQREHKRHYAKEYYDRDPGKNIAYSTAARRRRRKPVFKECIAPHPTKPGALCGNKFEVKPTLGKRPVTCSPECRVRRRWALQRERYRADPQAKRDYKNEYYAENYGKPAGKTRCPNPACGREYLKKRSNQHTCGRAVCHLWQYSQTHQDQINERKRKKRRGNPVYAAYQRNYRAANQDKFESYQPKKADSQRRRRAAARQAAIADGTFVDRRSLRRKLTDAQRSTIIQRRRAGAPLAKIAKSYGVSIATISQITKKKRAK